MTARRASPVAQCLRGTVAVVILLWAGLNALYAQARPTAGEPLSPNDTTSPLYSSPSLELGLYVGGDGVGLRVGATQPFGHPKRKRKRTRYTLGSLQLTAYTTHVRGELSFRGGIGLRRMTIRPNGFIMGYTAEVEYLMTTSESLESNVNTRRRLTTHTYVSGFGISPLGGVFGYDWAIRGGSRLRIAFAPRTSLDLYPDGQAASGGGLINVMALLNLSLLMP